MPAQYAVTRELTEVWGLWGLNATELARIEGIVNTPLAIATINPDQYQSVAPVLRKAGWHCMGRHKNPGHDHDGNYLWMKHFDKRPLEQEPKGIRPFASYGCCGMHYWYDAIFASSEYMIVHRVSRGAKRPDLRHWRRLASFPRCSYWTNAKDAK